MLTWSDELPSVADRCSLPVVSQAGMAVDDSIGSVRAHGHAPRPTLAEMQAIRRSEADGFDPILCL